MGARDEQIRGLLRPQSRTLRQAGRADAERYYSPDNLLELDEDLFSALGAQLGGENESLRNLLLDANAKIGELDSIKSAVGKLVDPVSKALCAFEAEKSEKISLQTTLNNTRTAYGKLRNEVAELEKKAAFSEKECQALRQELATTQNLLRGLEATKAEIAIDVAARRAQIVDLEVRLAQETGEARRCARRTAGSTNVCPVPTSGRWRLNPSLTGRVSGC